MSFKVQLHTDKEIYLKDPQSTDLGKKIIGTSVDLIYLHGLEFFTFKKLAHEINSVEASVYRYFRNKIQLFAYLSALYWEWQSFRIDYHTISIRDHRLKLKKVIELLLNHEMDNELMVDVDNYKLHHIIINQGNKVFHTQSTDKNNEEGFFSSFKKFTNLFSLIISKINPEYPYPHILSSMIIESMYSQLYYKDHLPSLTDKREDENYKNELKSMAIDLVNKVLA